MKNTCPFYIVFQVLKVLPVKILRYAKKDTATISFISCCFYWLLHQQVYIIFHKFLEIHSTLFEKKVFVRFYVFNRFTQAPPPP